MKDWKTEHGGKYGQIGLTIDAMLDYRQTIPSHPEEDLRQLRLPLR